MQSCYCCNFSCRQKMRKVRKVRSSKFRTFPCHFGLLHSINVLNIPIKFKLLLGNSTISFSLLIDLYWHVLACKCGPHANFMQWLNILCTLLGSVINVVWNETNNQIRKLNDENHWTHRRMVIMKKMLTHVLRSGCRDYDVNGDEGVENFASNAHFASFACTSASCSGSNGSLHIKTRMFCT